MVRKITKWHLMIPFLSDYHRHAILADFERELGVPHQTLKKYADVLVRSGIFIEERKPKNVVYSLRRENPMVLNYISAAEKIVLEETLGKNVLLRRLYEMLSARMGEMRFLIFGSSASGVVGNDIDLLAVGSRSIKDDAERLGETYGKKVHLLESKDFQVSKALFSEVMKKHLMFNGFDQFVRSFWEFAWKS